MSYQSYIHTICFGLADVKDAQSQNMESAQQYVYMQPSVGHIASIYVSSGSVFGGDLCMFGKQDGGEEYLESFSCWTLACTGEASLVSQSASSDPWQSRRRSEVATGDDFLNPNDSPHSTHVCRVWMKGTCQPRIKIGNKHFDRDVFTFRSFSRAWN